MRVLDPRRVRPPDARGLPPRHCRPERPLQHVLSEGGWAGLVTSVRLAWGQSGRWRNVQPCPNENRPSSTSVFLGVSGVDPGSGLSATTAHEAALGEAMIRAARQVVVLADASKLGARSFRRMAPLCAIDRLITDAAADPEVVAAVEAEGVVVEIV
ncbi:MAG: hypothetical protein AAF845_15715 [Bacteroidota bacterium]